jgi:uncharacterized membrane protein (DUF485 family)
MSMASSLSGGDRYVAAYDSARFKDLRRQAKTFILWASVVFTGWWLVAIVLGAFAPEFYRQKITENVNVGLLFVLVAFALVLVIAPMYLRYARTRLDPLAEEIRADLEGDSR